MGKEKKDLEKGFLKKRKTITFYAEPALEDMMHKDAAKKDLNISQWIRRIIRRELTGSESKVSS